jgi:hypothetical protein
MVRISEHKREYLTVAEVTKLIKTVQTSRLEASIPILMLHRTENTGHYGFEVEAYQQARRSVADRNHSIQDKTVAVFATQ